jgi:hypothetical protein
MEPSFSNRIEPDPTPQTLALKIKQPYQKPEMIYLAPLEAMALICLAPGKADAGCQFTES